MKSEAFLRHALPLGAVLVAGHALAANPKVLSIDQVGAEYVRPHRRVEVEKGRALNLYCIGSGSPTVVFESGLSDWSSTWALIQPAVATRTRACSYDRPGMGYSDPSPHSPTPDHAVSDLHTLLDRADITDSLVLVGHSLGGFYSKLFAVTYPKQVAGLVLVDPSEERLWLRVGPGLTPRFGDRHVAEAAADDAGGIREGVAHFGACAEATRQGKLDDAMYARCTDPERKPLGAAILAERRRLQPALAYQEAQAAEFRFSMFTPDAEADARYAALFSGKHLLGDKPLVVLTHSLWDMTPPFGEIGWQSWLTAHQQTAALSTRGRQRMVEMTRHNIQVDQPQAVIDAVVEVLDALEVRHHAATSGVRRTEE